MALEKKTSLFAQRMLKKREECLVVVNEEASSPNIFGDRSYLSESSADAESIHRENVERLALMSSQELMEEKCKLLVEMDPGLVEFLKSRRLQKQRVEARLDEDIPSLTDTSSGGANESSLVEIPLEVKQLVNRYPNMDTLETDKLKWIGEMPEPQPPPIDKPYNARFDFDGTLLRYTDKGEGLLKGLHNHGEEQSRPGYTLLELIQLTRSSVLQQRVIALNTLSKVLYNAQYKYEGCFESSLMSKLLEDPELYLLFRFSMDDISVPVVLAAANAMTNLIVNHTDENCLDLMLGMPWGLHQPSFEVGLELSELDINEMKDKELLKLDIVRGAVRTQLIERIRYVMCELKPEPLDIKQLLKCLTRIARHSFELAQQVVSCRGLLGSLHTLLMHSGKATSYFPEALKLLRVLVCQSSMVAGVIVNEHSILSTVFSFIAGDVGSGHPETMHLTLESFYIWQTVLSYKMNLDSISSFAPVLLRLLEAHLGLTTVTTSSSSDLEHATAIMSLLTPVVRFAPVEVLRLLLPIAVQLTIKWLSQLLMADSIRLHAAKLIGAALYLMAQVPEDVNVGNDLNPMIDRLLTSECFLRIAELFSNYSWLVSGQLSKCPENLPGLGSGLVPPFLKLDSCFGIVQGVGIYVTSVHAPPKLAALFLQHEGIICYINRVLNNPEIDRLFGHWYARQESLLLLLIIDTYVRLRSFLFQEVSSQLSVYSQLAFLLTSAVHSPDRHLLTRIFSDLIFNPTLFWNSLKTISKNMGRLNLKDEPATPPSEELRPLIDRALNDCESIRRVYFRELGLDESRMVSVMVPTSLTRSLTTATKPAFPADWPFLPIVGVYNKRSLSGKEEDTLTRCLQYNLLLEEFQLGELCPATSPTAKYCRLACVYLAGNDFFRELTPLLGAILNQLIQHKSQALNFDSPIPGLTSFYDFYRELLEQFVGVSYGDQIFGQFVLVPLAQKHNVKYKKLVWSEMAPVIRFLGTPLNMVNIRDYLEPCEIDSDMLMIYLQSLATCRVNESWCPVLYRMAVHHVATYIASCDPKDKVGMFLIDRINKLGNKELQLKLTIYKPD